MGNLCAFGPPNEPSPPQRRKNQSIDEVPSVVETVIPIPSSPAKATTKKEEPQKKRQPSTHSPPKPTATTNNTSKAPPRTTTSDKSIQNNTDSNSKSTIAANAPPPATTNKGSYIASKTPANTTTTTTATSTPTSTPTPAPTTPSNNSSVLSSSPAQSGSKINQRAASKGSKIEPTPSAPSAPASEPERKGSIIAKAPICAKCNNTIIGSVIQALGKEFHDNCFTCEQCKGPLSGKFAVKGGNPYCSAECAGKSGSRIGGKAPAVNKPVPGTFGGRAQLNQQPSTSKMAGTFAGRTEASEAKKGTMGLLEWCKKRTAGYPNVQVRDFVKSWADGLALCALMHSYRPDLIDFDSLKPSEALQNITLGLEVSEKLGIPELIDPEDFALEKLSMMTYLSTAYSKLKDLD